MSEVELIRGSSWLSLPKKRLLSLNFFWGQKSGDLIAFGQNAVTSF